MDRFQVTPSLAEFFIDSGKTATLTNIGTATIYGAPDTMFPNVAAAAWSLAPGATRVEDYGTLWVRTADGASSTLTVDPIATGTATDIGTGQGSALGSGGSSAPTGAAGGDLSGTYPNPTVPGVATAIAAATAANNNVAATALGQTFGTESGTPISPWRPSPVMGDEYWSVGTGGHIATSAGLNSWALAPTLTADGTNKSTTTRVVLDNTANDELCYRLEFDYAITVASGQGAAIEAAVTNTTGTLLAGTSRQRLVTASSPRPSGHFVMDFIPKGAGGTSALELKLQADTTATSGTVSIRNVSVKLVGSPSRPMLIGVYPATNDVHVYWQQYRPRTMDWQASRLKFGDDSELLSPAAYTFITSYTTDQPWSTAYPDAAFLNGEAAINNAVGSAAESASPFNLRANNNDQIIEVETATAGTYELRCNVHGGETQRTAPTWKVDYGNGWVPFTPTVGLEAVRRVQVTVPTHVKRTADAAGDYFANVDHVYTMYPDGVIRCDRTTTFLKDTRVKTLFEWMTSHELGGRLGRLGAGQSIIAEVDTFVKLTTPAAPTLATATTGGTLAAATYSYRVAALSADGETLASVAATQATTGTTSTVTVTPATVTNAVAYAIYGRTAGSERLLTIVAAGQAWIDTGSIGPTAQAPRLLTSARRPPVTGTANDFKSSSKATWGVFLETGSEWCTGSIYDRDSILSRAGVASNRIAFGATSGAIQKNYGIVRWSGGDTFLVASGTVWSATHWNITYRPNDVADYHREIAQRAASLDALKTLYPSGADYTAPTVAFAPSQVQNAYELWSPSAATADGTAYASLTGSIHGRVLTQGTSGKQPTKQTVNAQPVIRFDGVDDFLQLSDSFLQPAWVFITAKFRSPYVNGDTLVDGGNNNSMILQRKNSTQITTYAGAFGPLVTQDVESAFHVFTALFNGASSELRVDGGSATTGNPGTANPGGVTVGSRASGLNNGPIDVRDILVVTDSLSSTDRAAIETWMLARKP